MLNPVAIQSMPSASLPAIPPILKNLFRTLLSLPTQPCQPPWRGDVRRPGRRLQLPGGAADDALQRLVEERTAQLRASSLALSCREERERQALAEDLHAGSSQLLAVAQFKLGTLRRHVESVTGRGLCACEIEEVAGLIRAADLALRAVSTHLAPAAPRPLDLASGLDWLAGTMRQRYGLQVNLHLATATRRLDSGRLGQVLRAVRELLVNVAEHAQVAQAEIEAFETEDSLIVSVSDTGTGFDLAQAPGTAEDDGRGLAAVRGRIGLLGGEVQIDSQVGDGTVVVIGLPF